MKPVNVRLDYDLYRELIELREGIGIPVAESLRRAVREYVAKQKQRAIDDYSQSLQVQNLPNK